MAVGWLGRWAAAAPVPVFAAGGAGAGSAAVELGGHPDIRLVATPRHASLLVAAGRFPGELGEALARVHDALPHPRGALWWSPPDGAEPPAGWEDAEVVVGGDPVPAIVATHRAICTGTHPSRPDLRPDAPPHPFDGRGDHGQGGEGMMGGVPFGRPMAMTADDLRDGLSLDRLSLRAGPFLLGLPPSTALDVVLQGDVVQEAHLRLLAGGEEDDEITGDSVLDPVLACFGRAQREPVPVAELERARARHLLRWLAGACYLAGLDALAARAAACARALGSHTPHEWPQVARLARAVRHSGLPAAWSGVGRLSTDHPALTGPGARATGRGGDARQDDPAYRQLGFTPLAHESGDARARLEQRLAEAQQALELAAAGDGQGTVHDPAAPVEPPQGSSDAATLIAVGDQLVGTEWGDALITLCSLDLAVETVAAVEVGA